MWRQHRPRAARWRSIRQRNAPEGIFWERVDIHGEEEVITAGTELARDGRESRSRWGSFSLVTCVALLLQSYHYYLLSDAWESSRTDADGWRD